MLISSIPTKYQIPWGNSAGPAYIRTPPVPSQIGINAGAASFTDGFTPSNMTAISAGGVPPFGQDMNGILKSVTQWLQWVQAGGGVVPYDATFQTQIGGYPQGTVVASATTLGLFWQTIADNNLNNPDASGDNWITYGDGARNDLKWRPTGEVLPGWMKLNATTIGSASSGASQLAMAVALGAYTWLWTNFSNTQCPVTGGRGGTALADFNANKPIAAFDMRGYGAIGMDTMGGGTTTRLTGVPVTTGAANIAGSQIGETLHALITAELASHNHGVTDPTHFHTQVPFAAQPVGTGASNALGGNGASSSNATNVTINNAGSGTAHNTVQSSITGTWYLKL
jgi:hypothetical protein